MTINLDAQRAEREAARREADLKGPVVIIDGKECELAPELPYVVLEALKGMQSEGTAGAALVTMVEGILGEHYDQFLSINPSVDDVNALVNGVMREYGIEAPLAS